MRVVVLIAALFAMTSAHADTYLHIDVKIGPYFVGLRMQQQYDQLRVYRTRFNLASGRVSEGDSARPLLALAWYPAREGAAAMERDIDANNRKVAQHVKRLDTVP
jgi:hypothetical protein